MRALFAFLFRLSGWKVEGKVPDIPKYIIIVAPHTSNWDFLVGVGARAYLRIGFAKFLGKKSLFKPPLGWLMRALGGYPVDRSKSTNLVDAVVDLFNSKEEFVITLAPEGTRSKVERLRTGFWYMSKGANVPMVMVSFDYPTKTVHWREPLMPTTLEEDMPRIMEFFGSMRGKRPELGVG